MLVGQAAASLPRNPGSIPHRDTHGRYGGQSAHPQLHLLYLHSGSFILFNQQPNPESGCVSRVTCSNTEHIV